MFTAAFWRAAFERAVKTFSQMLVTMVGADVTNVVSTGLGDKVVLALVAAGLSVLTSLASSKIGNDGPSLANESIDPYA